MKRKKLDPSAMELRADVGEPDGGVLVPGSRAVVSLNAYPDLTFTAHFESFRIDKSDPHLLPDLSAAIVILPPETKGGAN